MMKCLVAIVVLAMAVGIVWGMVAGHATSAPAPNPKIVAEAGNTFAANLYGQLAARPGNLFFSPMSLDTALLMTCAGARGDTQQQMAITLGVSTGRDDVDWAGVHSSFSAFLKDLLAKKDTVTVLGYQLSAANALWGQKGFDFLPNYLKVVQDNYGAGLSDVDFAADTEGARKTINAWTERATRDKIKDLLQPGVLTTQTRLVLTNAIYFQGQWEHPFRKTATSPGAFHPTTDKNAATLAVPMMRGHEHYGYLAGDNFQAVQLMYAGRNLSMILLLPKDVDGLAAVEKQLTPQFLAAKLGSFRNEDIYLTMPKFTVTTECELAPTLAAMGMKDAFDAAKADFSGMTGKKGLFLSAVIHKTFVDVNEAGTEAAAATAIPAAAADGGDEMHITVDHPFLFLIRHEPFGAILFMGRVTDPTK
jgi:serine protease inhibitor